MQRHSIVLIISLGAAWLMGCQNSDAPSVSTSGVEGSGTLRIEANGEDFVRQGLTSKDGWAIRFEHVYVHLADLKAYQTEPPFDPDADSPLEAIHTAALPAITIDLAVGDDNATPRLVGQVDAPAGHYNALSWKMTPAQAGPAIGQALVLMGQATQAGQTLPFTLKVNREFAYTCGEYVGDERKGILQAGQTATLEATFHFDHLFGDGTLPAEDELNRKALGCAPLAALAKGEGLELDWATLQQQLPPQAFQTLETNLTGMGHVGEGHCRSKSSMS